MTERPGALAAQKASWNKFAAGWKSRDEFIDGWMRPISDVMIARAGCAPGFRVLDAATGIGHPGLEIAEMIGDGEVIGTDNAEEMVALANEKAASLGRRNYRALAAPTHQLPFDEASFDAAVSRFGVIFAPDVLADVAEVRRVLKPGAKFSASAWSMPERNPWATIIPKALKGYVDVPTPPPDAPGIWRCASEGSLEAIMKEAGFKDVETTETKGAFTVGSPEEYWGIMMEIAAPIAGLLANVDDATRDKVKADVLETVRNGFMKDGQVAMPWSSWVVTGTK
ncbi:MAG TPA: methyltransferase domain-containing protein [Patescibacteria group bacterium]|nr:methyltransferase domain-containing protein [Patescibacteria group bacterium]